MKRRIHKAARISIGVALCAVVAALAAGAFSAYEWRRFVPFGFVLVVIALARRYGVAVSLFGSLAAAAIFAYFLYPPVGSLSVENQDARVNLAWMLLIATAVSYLLAGPSEPGTKQR